MFTDNDLRELLDFVAPEPVLSLYLSTDPSEGNADAYRLRLKTMLKEIQLPQDVSAVEEYFKHQYDWSGRATAVFSCAARNFFRAYPLAVPMRNLVNVNDRPSVKPLADLMDNFGNFGVVLVDKQGARVFYFHMGELREQEGVLGETVKHVKRGGASSSPGRSGSMAEGANHMEEVVDRNMKESVDFSVHFFEESHVRRVLVGGSNENVSLYQNLLPKSWQNLVLGTFTLPMTASNLEVRQMLMRIGTQAAEKAEIDLVEMLMTHSAKKNGAVTGMQETYHAINQDRVKNLVFVENLRKEGFVCNQCGAIFAEKADDLCPQCGSGKLERTLDGIELAVNAVMRHGGDVTVVRASSPIDGVQGIGAILRY